MANQTNTRDTESIWRSNARILLPAVILVFALLFTTAYSNIIVAAYGAKLVVCCCCMAFYGFLAGFEPQSENRSIRRMRYFTTVLMMGALLIQIAAQIAGIYDLPLEKRNCPLLTPHYWVTYALLAGTLVVSHYIATVLFHRLHPDTAIIPLIPEDREQLAQPSPEARRTLRKSMLVVFIVFIPTFVSIFLFPKHSIQTILATMLLTVSGVSAFIGWRWNVSDASGRRFAVVLGLIGPIAIFVGSFSASKAYDLLHVLRALKFAAIMATALWMPALIVRLARRNRP